jgi:hypothetical protein
MRQRNDVWPAFERKARHRNIDPARFAERFEKRIGEWRARRDAERAEHLAGEPDEFQRSSVPCGEGFGGQLTAGAR